MKRLFLILLLVLISVALIWGDGLSAGKVKSSGLLTYIENDGSVVIDKYGYMVSLSARILNHQKRPVSLRTFKLPIRVDFEYEHTTRGPIIILIEEIPDVVPQ